MRDIAAAWKEASGGKINVRLYAGGVAGDEPDMVRKMRVGQLHAAALTGAGLATIAPEIQALQMPMMLRSYAELDYVRDRLAPQLEAMLAARGFKVLHWGDAGWVHFFTQQPVVRPEDLQPLKLFTWAGDTTYIEAWKDAGYNPIPLAATEIHTGLQSGLINAFATTPLAALSFQWFGQARHMTDLKWAPLVGALVVTMEKWQELSAALQPRLLEAAREAGGRLLGEGRKLNDEAVEMMQRYGLVIHSVPPEIVVHWEQRARAVYPTLVGKVVPTTMVAEVERLRNAYRTAQ
jgi:TRAP-type C4-dicarboxylate transport system substrate-binding protein